MRLRPKVTLMNCIEPICCIFDPAIGLTLAFEPLGRKTTPLPSQNHTMDKEWDSCRELPVSLRKIECETDNGPG